MATRIEDRKSETLVDELGELQAQIGELKARESAIKGELIDRGENAEGEWFYVNLSDVNRSQVNWHLIARKLGASRQMITSHTRRQTYTAVRVYEKEEA